MTYDSATAATADRFKSAIDHALNSKGKGFGREAVAQFRSTREPGDELGVMPQTDDVVLVRLADVKATSIEWVWPGRFAAGKLTIIVGDPGVGKSWMTLDAAARISRGASWPDGSRAPAGDVILLSAEDALGDTIRPRLDDLGADVARIHALTAIRDVHGRRTPDLSRDLDQIERSIVSTGARAVFIDPLSAYLGDTDSHRDAEVRSILAPTAALAGRTGATIGAVMHLGKAGQRPALYRAIGSIAFVAAARLVLAVAVHPQDPTRRVLAPVKSNICLPAPTLSYRLLDGRLLWDADPVAGIDADVLLGQTAEDRETQTDADSVIAALLADVEAWPLDATEVLETGRAHGISDRTMQRTAKRLGIRITRKGFGRGGKWVWNLPDIPDTSIPDTRSIHGGVSSMASKGEPEQIDDNNNIDDTKRVRTCMTEEE